MKTLEQMQADGIDTVGAMERFMGNEEMFRAFLRKLPKEQVYEELLVSLEAKDVEEAFSQAHRLKGLLGNLSLVEAYNCLYDIVEILRDGKLPEKEDVQRFQDAYERIIEYIQQV